MTEKPDFKSLAKELIKDPADHTDFPPATQALAMARKHRTGMGEIMGEIRVHIEAACRQGKTSVMINERDRAFGVDRPEWQWIADELAAKGYRVNLPGHALFISWAHAKPEVKP